MLLFFFLQENNVEKKNGRFVCKKCERVYKYQHNLVKHLENDCIGRPQFQCPKCSYCTKQLRHLNRHVNSVHNSAGNTRKERKEIVTLDNDSNSGNLKIKLYICFFLKQFY